MRFGIQRFIGGRWIPYGRRMFVSEVEAFRHAVWVYGLRPSEQAGADSFEGALRPWRLADLNLPPTLDCMAAAK